MIRLKALQSFARLGGRVKRGTEFSTNESHAAYLTAQGLAERLDSPSESTEVGPSEAQRSPTPEQTQVGVTHVGGGWYEWNGKRYRGREAAEAAKGG